MYSQLIKLLKQAPSLSGVDVHIGEEFVSVQNISYPRITLVPTVGYLAPGVGYAVDDYLGDTDDEPNMLWDLNETIQVVCMARGMGNAPSSEDNFDAIAVLRQKVLQGFRQQRFHFDPTIGAGFYVNITPTKGWFLQDPAIIKVCRAYILELSMKWNIPDITATTATIEHIGITEDINNSDE